MKTFMGSALTAFVAYSLVLVLPISASAYVDYGAYYYTPAPNSQAYYQPMYAYSASPVLNQGVGKQNTYINYPQQNYSYGYSQQQYSYPQYNSYQQYPHYNSYPSYSYQQYQQYPSYNSYQPYGGGNMYGQNVPYSYGYPTGDTVPLIGGQLCEFPDYDGRALCGSNPNQWVYDPWTGSWY